MSQAQQEKEKTNLNPLSYFGPTDEIKEKFLKAIAKGMEPIVRRLKRDEVDDFFQEFRPPLTDNEILGIIKHDPSKVGGERITNLCAAFGVYPERILEFKLIRLSPEQIQDWLVYMREVGAGCYESHPTPEMSDELKVKQHIFLTACHELAGY